MIFHLQDWWKKFCRKYVFVFCIFIFFFNGLMYTYTPSLRAIILGASDVFVRYFPSVFNFKSKFYLKSKTRTLHTLLFSLYPCKRTCKDASSHSPSVGCIFNIISSAYAMSMMWSRPFSIRHLRLSAVLCGVKLCSLVLMLWRNLLLPSSGLHVSLKNCYSAHFSVKSLYEYLVSNAKFAMFFLETSCIFPIL